MKFYRSIDSIASFAVICSVLSLPFVFLIAAGNLPVNTRTANSNSTTTYPVVESTRTDINVRTDA